VSARSSLGAFVLSCALLLFGTGTSPRRADEPDPPSLPQRESDAATSGRLTFLLHCAGCHGENGEGGGPMTPLLRVAPPDLTRLSAARGGAFPEQELVRVIDGRSEIAGHDTRTMPVWGIGLREPGSDADQEARVRHRIRNLVSYLRTLQHPAGD
jgi:mono/diheme cytochrome c family protein